MASGAEKGGLGSGSTEHIGIVDSEDEERNTAVLEEDLVPQHEPKDKTEERRVNIGRKPREGNQIFKIKTEFTEITIRLVERQK